MYKITLGQYLMQQQLVYVDTIKKHFQELLLAQFYSHINIKIYSLNTLVFICLNSALTLIHNNEHG